MTKKIVGEKYIVVDDTSKHGLIYESEVTLVRDDGSQMPFFKDEEGKGKYLRMNDVRLLSEFKPVNVQVLAGDKFEVVSNPKEEHSFEIGEIVTATGEYFTFLEGNIYEYRNEKDKSQYVRLSDLKRVETFGEELDDLIGTLSSYTIPTEHRPRDTDFTLNVTEEAIKDEILLITYLYHGGSLSLREIGSLLSVDEATIRRRMKKHGVPTRTVSQALRAKYSL